MNSNPNDRFFGPDPIHGICDKYDVWSHPIRSYSRNGASSIWYGIFSSKDSWHELAWIDWTKWRNLVHSSILYSFCNFEISWWVQKEYRFIRNIRHLFVQSRFCFPGGQTCLFSFSEMLIKYWQIYVNVKLEICDERCWCLQDIPMEGFQLCQSWSECGNSQKAASFQVLLWNALVQTPNVSSCELLPSFEACECLIRVILNFLRKHEFGPRN